MALLKGTMKHRVDVLPLYITEVFVCSKCGAPEQTLLGRVATQGQPEN